jgi:hypothetical protein
MIPVLPAELRDEPIDDFYLECGELQGGIRRPLARLEIAGRTA